MDGLGGTERQRGRGRTIAIVAGVVAVAVAALAAVVLHYHLLDRGKSTALSVAEAQRRFHSTTTSSTFATTTTVTDATSTTSTADTAAGTTMPPVVAQLPAPGVYVYATTGHDSIDALNGDHHDYAATSTITVRAAGCGVVERWDALVQRWEERQRCIVDNRIAETGWLNYDQFFGQGETDTFVCSGPGRPVDAPAGTTWTQSCLKGGTTINAYAGVVIGTEPMQVGDTTVDTLHVRVTITTPVASDAQVRDTWYLLGSDLVIAQTSTSQTSNQTVVGLVHYKEQFEIHLTSLTPLT